MRILVVDDIESNVYQLQVLLGAHGYTVDAAANGAEALAKARQFAPDLVITDILMPVMDGFSLCRKWMLDESLKRIPLIFYTATYNDEKDRDFGLSLGAARFIVKPEEHDSLLRTIETVIAEHQRGARATAVNPVPDEEVYLKEYSEALVRKLEDKNRDLERANRQLERDLDERRRMEDALRQEQLLFDSLARNIPDHIYFKDRASRFVRINHSMAQSFGLRDPAEAVGKTDFDMFNEAHAQKAFADEQRIMEQGEPMVGIEEKEIWIDGRVTWVSSTKVPLVDAQGRVTGLVGISRDITEKKLMEEKFLQAQRLEGLGMLSAGIAHDLNNILAPIMCAAPLLRHSASSAQDLSVLDTLEKCAERGAGLVKQILAFSRSASGEHRPTQVKHLVRDVVGMIEATFPKSIQLKTQIPADLWVVQGNPTQIHQMVLNLCVNARDAMPQGGVLKVAVANQRLDAAEAEKIPGARPGTWVMVEVTDTGMGIAPEVLPHIWTPFFTTKASGKGTGLGLSTVRGLVAGHRGFVAVQSDLGQGSTFRVYLPATDGEFARPPSATPWEIPFGDGELILVVDDDAAIRNSIAAVLAKHGYRVQCCEDGVEALAAFQARAGEFSLIVTDVDMPRLSGEALARVVLQLRPDVRVLAISGLPDDEGESSGVPSIRGMAHAFLAKPFRVDDLRATVHRVLHSAEKPH